MWQCVELEDCGINLTRPQLKNQKKSDPGLEMTELPVRTRKANKSPKKRDDKKKEIVTDAKEEKPAAFPQKEVSYPGIRQERSQEIKHKEQLYLSLKVKKHQSLETH